MIRTGRIRDITGNTVTLIGEQSGACLGCRNRDCPRRLWILRAANPHGLPLSPGQTVEAEISRPSLIREVLVILLLPILGFIAGYFFTGLLLPAGEAAGGVLGLLGTAFLNYRIRRRFPPGTNIRILRVVDGVEGHCLFG